MMIVNENYPIEYDIMKIQDIIQKNNFPEKYDFIENEKPTFVNIKDQGSCQSCWAMTSTTFLAYRFHKLGVEVDLSPQHAISCYRRDCKIGNYVLDTFLNLVRNGTVTEECFKYSSKKGDVEKCRTCRRHYKKLFPILHRKTLL